MNLNDEGSLSQLWERHGRALTLAAVGLFLLVSVAIAATFYPVDVSKDAPSGATAVSDLDDPVSISGNESFTVESSIKYEQDSGYYLARSSEASKRLQSIDGGAMTIDESVSYDAERDVSYLSATVEKADGTTRHTERWAEDGTLYTRHGGLTSKQVTALESKYKGTDKVRVADADAGAGYIVTVREVETNGPTALSVMYSPLSLLPQVVETSEDGTYEFVESGVYRNVNGSVTHGESSERVDVEFDALATSQADGDHLNPVSVAFNPTEHFDVTYEERQESTVPEEPPEWVQNAKES